MTRIASITCGWTGGVQKKKPNEEAENEEEDGDDGSPSAEEDDQPKHAHHEKFGEQGIVFNDEEGDGPEGNTEADT